MSVHRIRPAVAADREAVLPLAGALSTSFQVRPEAFGRSFDRMLDDPGVHLLVALDADEPCGYLLGFRHLTFYANGPVGWIEEVYVAGSARRGGVGAALVSAFEEWARKQGCALVALATRRAERFYTAIGYEISARYLRKVL